MVPCHQSTRMAYFTRRETVLLPRLREEIFAAGQAEEPLQDPFRRQAVQMPDLRLRHLGLGIDQEAHPGPH